MTSVKIQVQNECKYLTTDGTAEREGQGRVVVEEGVEEIESGMINDEMKAERDIGGVENRGDEALVLANICTVIRTTHIKYFIILCNSVCVYVFVCARLCVFTKSKSKSSGKVQIHQD